MMLQCPCCGYYTITDNSEICDICLWQYDVPWQNDPNRDGGANKVSLNEAISNFRNFGAKEIRLAGNHTKRDPLPIELPENQIRIPCPSCGNYTVVGHEYELCGVCGFQYIQELVDNPDRAIGTNEPSLNESMINYKKYGSICEDYAKYARKPLPEELPENNQKS